MFQRILIVTSLILSSLQVMAEQIRLADCFGSVATEAKGRKEKEVQVRVINDITTVKFYGQAAIYLYEVQFRATSYDTSIYNRRLNELNGKSNEDASGKSATLKLYNMGSENNITSPRGEMIINTGKLQFYSMLSCRQINGLTNQNFQQMAPPVKRPGYDFVQ